MPVSSTLETDAVNYEKGEKKHQSTDYYHLKYQKSTPIDEQLGPSSPHHMTL